MATKINIDERLIELVRENSVLYDKKDPKYLNNKYKGHVWDAIANELNVTGHFYIE